LAHMIGLSPTQVKIWFQNHRYKAKKGETNFSKEAQMATMNSGQASNQPVLTPFRTERTLLAGYTAHDEAMPLSRSSIAARLRLHSKTGGGKMNDEDVVDSLTAGSDDVAGNISDVSPIAVATQKTDVVVAAGRSNARAKYFQPNNASITTFHVIPRAASSKTQPHSPVALSSQNWSHFSEHLARLQCQEQQQEQNGGGTSLIELKPVHIAGLGAVTVSASSASGAEVSNVDIARAGGSGSGYLSVPRGGFGFPPSYCGGAYGSCTVTSFPTESSSPYLADDGRTW